MAAVCLLFTSNPLWAQGVGNDIVGPGICAAQFIEGCIGECVSETGGATFIAYYTIPGKRPVSTYCITKVPEFTLCDAYSGILTITINGITIVFNGDLNLPGGRTVVFEAKGGDVIEFNCSMVDRHNGVLCKRLGEVRFQLGVAPSLPLNAGPSTN